MPYGWLIVVVMVVGLAVMKVWDLYFVPKFLLIPQQTGLQGDQLKIVISERTTRYIHYYCLFLIIFLVGLILSFIQWFRTLRYVRADQRQGRQTTYPSNSRLAARMKDSLRTGGIVLALMGLLCMPAGAGISPKRDIHIFAWIADTGAFLKASLWCFGIGISLLLLSFLIPAKKPERSSG